MILPPPVRYCVHHNTGLCKVQTEKLPGLHMTVSPDFFYAFLSAVFGFAAIFVFAAVLVFAAVFVFVAAFGFAAVLVFVAVSFRAVVVFAATLFFATVFFGAAGSQENTIIDIGGTVICMECSRPSYSSFFAALTRGLPFPLPPNCFASLLKISLYLPANGSPI